MIPLLTIPEGRGTKVERKGVLFINDAYNAAASSVKGALAAMPQPQEGGRRIAVLAEMPELGKFSEQCHQEVGAFALDYIDALYCIGEVTKPMVRDYLLNGGKRQKSEDRGKWVEVEWDQALDLVAGKLADIKKESGSDSIGFLASAKCTNEENYLIQKFARQVIGTHSVDHCARL